MKYLFLITLFLNGFCALAQNEYEYDTTDVYNSAKGTYEMLVIKGKILKTSPYYHLRVKNNNPDFKTCFGKFENESNVNLNDLNAITSVSFLNKGKSFGKIYYYTLTVTLLDGSKKSFMSDLKSSEINNEMQTFLKTLKGGEKIRVDLGPIEAPDETIVYAQGISINIVKNK